jgi:dihydrofolate reductase
MGRLRVACFSISVDGYGAGPSQDLENPMGLGGMALHQWVFKTRSFQDTHGEAGAGVTGVDDDFARRGMENLGAWILGRNMFGPVRGPWPDDSWRGWWGDNPPYHVPVYVLTHFPKRDLVMEGDNTFHFVTGGIHEALRLARAAAGDRDIRLGGGVQTVRAYVAAGLVDELHLAVSPVLLGRGENLFAGLDMAALGYRVTEHVPGADVTHVVLTRGG